MTPTAIGIDFGTTNSSIACASSNGEVRLAQFPYSGGITDSYRSLLYLEQVREHRLMTVKTWTGPEAIDHYLAAENKGRLIQSLKSFLTSRSLQTTEVFGRRVKLEELIARILRDLRAKAESQFGQKIDTAVVGRPVQFVGAGSEADNTFAEERLAETFRLAGFVDVQFEFEPVAAAHFYEARLDHDELILIGDFGGGTSDFSVLHVGPGVRKRGRTSQDLLANSGVGLAGDAFDAKIVRHLVSPELGRGSMAQSFNKVLPAVPNSVYTKLERWHHLSFLRTKDVMNMLNSSKVQAFEPEKIEALIHLIQEDLGYQLHRSVQQVKYDLSRDASARFHFTDGFLDIEAVVQRSSFEDWIGEELEHIETSVDAAIAASGIQAADIDRVFLTGGSSLVPVVRRIFEKRFGAERIRAGNEFTSVASGLALKALEAFPAGASRKV